MRIDEGKRKEVINLGKLEACIIADGLDYDMEIVGSFIFSEAGNHVYRSPTQILTGLVRSGEMVNARKGDRDYLIKAEKISSYTIISTTDHFATIDDIR